MAGIPGFGRCEVIAPDELIIDNFAGGGGASTGIKQSLGRTIDYAINHNAEALAMHRANHPWTKHLCEDVWKVDIAALVNGRKVGLCWFSPDCKHFSKAKGGKPVENKIRGLAWVALRWAGIAKPRVIVLENVEEFATWGPVLADGQPCKRRAGMTFKRWCTQLRNLGYVVDYRELRACDYGAPTIRKRLFVIARQDGMPIVWPEPTHAKQGDLFLQQYRTAVDCIDWSIPCPSIFLTKEQGRAIGVKRPLADATMRRIAAGLKRYVIDAAEPFIVNMAQGGSTHGTNFPLTTICTEKGGSRALVTPYLAGVGGRMGQSPERPVTKPYQTITAKADTVLVSPIISRQFGASVGSSAESPLGTTTAGGGGKSALVAAFLAKHYTGVVGSAAREPIGTVTSKDHHSLVTSHLMKLRGTCRHGQPVTEPMATVSAGGTHIAEVRAFLMAYYRTGEGQDPSDPMRTIPTKDRFALVTVNSEDHQIVDIGMRMLKPRELFNAQGFPADYIIDTGLNEQHEPVKLTSTAQIRMCGNSVSPHPAKAIIEAQFAQIPAGRVA